jgi:xanthine dehydrogenase large subunit
VGFTQDGLITAMAVDFYSNGGAANDLSTAVLGRALCHAENAYYIPNVKLTGRVCKTNLPPNTAFRGFGGPQGIVNMENIMEEIACFLKKDAYDLRLLNCYGTTDRNSTPYGQIYMNNKLPEVFRQLAKTSGYKSRLQEIERFNRQSKTHLKGISMTPVKFGISFNTKFLNQANALINVYLDGTVQVSTGATEMGQGVNTKLQQLVADELCIPLERVRVMATSTEKNNNTSATAASSSSDLNGKACLDACDKIKTRLLEFAARHFEMPVSKMRWDYRGFYPASQPERSIPFSEMVKLAYRGRVNMGERGFYKTPGVDFDWATGTGTPFLYFTAGCAVSEVCIDRFTGDLKVLRSDLLMDIGKSMNPGIDRGQIVGAFVQGMGWATMEELRYASNGDLLSHSPTTYKIPNIQDLPTIFNAGWIENLENTVNIRGSKAVGEPPFILGISVWTAAKHALSFISKGEIPKLCLPATNEELLTRMTHYAQQPEMAIS